VSRFTQIADATFFDWPSTNCVTPPTCNSLTINSVDITYTFLNGGFSVGPISAIQQLGPDAPGDGRGFSAGEFFNNDTTFNFSQPIAGFGATFIHFLIPGITQPMPSLPATIQVYTGLNGTGSLIGSMTDTGGTQLSADFMALWSTTANIRSAVIKSSPAGIFDVDGIAISLTPAPLFPYHAGSFAQVASGAGWKTELTLYNSSSAYASARIVFHSDQGNELILPLNQDNAAAINASSVDLIVPANGSATVWSEAADAAAPLIGWADVEATALPGVVSGFSIFRLRRSGIPDSEGTVALDSRTSTSVVLGYDNTSGFQTGLALASEGKASTAAMTVRDESGTVLGMLQIPFSDMGHTAFMLADQFPLAASRRGTIEVKSTSAITGVSMRFNPSLTFTSLPILH
jgi:hypothetical protein